MKTIWLLVFSLNALALSVDTSTSFNIPKFSNLFDSSLITGNSFHSRKTPQVAQKSTIFSFHIKHEGTIVLPIDTPAFTLSKEEFDNYARIFAASKNNFWGYKQFNENDSIMTLLFFKYIKTNNLYDFYRQKRSPVSNIKYDSTVTYDRIAYSTSYEMNNSSFSMNCYKLIIIPKGHARPDSAIENHAWLNNLDNQVSFNKEHNPLAKVFLLLFLALFLCFMWAISRHINNKSILENNSDLSKGPLHFDYIVKFLLSLGIIIIFLAAGNSFFFLIALGVFYGLFRLSIKLLPKALVLNPSDPIVNFSIPTRTSRTLSFLIDFMIYGIFLYLFDYTSSKLSTTFPEANSIILRGGFTFYTSYLYFSLQWNSIHHATFGQRLLHLKTYTTTRHPLSFSIAYIRALSFTASCFSGLGILLSYFRKDNKCLHDIITYTQVLKYNDK